MSKKKPISLRLLAIVFLSGMVLMSLEIVGSRILAPRFGSTIYVWGSLISIFIGSLALGYYVGGKIADLWPGYRLLGILIGVAGVYIMCLPLFAPVVFNLFGAEKEGDISRFIVLGVSFMLFTFPSILLGCVSPFAVRLAAKSIERIGNIAGVLYAVGTLGSLLGTLLTAFVLIPATGHNSIVRMLGITLIVTAGLSILPGGKLRFGAAQIILLVLAGATAALALPRLPFDVVLGEGEYLIHIRNSEYHTIAVVDEPARTGYIFDKSTQLYRPCPGDELTGKRWLMFYSYVESGIWLDDAAYSSACSYTDLLWLPFIWKLNAKRAVFIGGGGGVVQRRYHDVHKHMHVDLVEIDQAVIDVAKEYFHLKETERLKLHCMDGRRYFRGLGKDVKYDIVILDAFSIGGQIPFHLTTREYLQEIKEHLNPDGVVLINVISALDGPKGKIFQHIHKTFESEFRQVYAFPKIRESVLDPYLSSNIIIVGTLEETRMRASDISYKARRLVREAFVPIARLSMHTGNYRPPGKLPLWNKAEPLTDDWAPVDTWVF
jgi:predicted membrane-bound spermidine synthase